MLTRALAEQVVGFCTGNPDMEALRSHTAPGFVFEIMGTQPAAGEWLGVDAMKWQFAEFKENFTSEFQFNTSGIYVDVEKKTAAVRLHSLPLTDKRGGEYQQHCGWFVYFDDHDKITRIVQCDDTKLVDDMTLRVATAKMRALQNQDSTRSIQEDGQRDRAA
jgi:ketosteroid isomerase-like protein